MTFIDSSPRDLEPLVFVGLNRHLVALDRTTGDEVWSWKSPKWSGFMSLHLDGDRLLVGSAGYLYCLDARTGEQLWNNALRGRGHGILTFASVRGSSGLPAAAQAIIQQQQNAAAAGGG